MSISNEVYVSDGLPFRQQYAFASDFEGGSIFSRSRNYSGYIGKKNERVGHGGWRTVVLYMILSSASGVM